jgi:hypothetical protein
MVDMVDKIIAYEGGEMPEDQVISFFQELLDSGLIWQLQGSYGRQAKLLIESGLIKVRNNATKGTIHEQD